MKVVLINDQLNAGGAEKVLIYIANLLYKNKVDVSVVLLLGKSVLDNQINANIPVHYLNRKSRFDMEAFRKLKQFVQYADIVHIHSRYNLRYYMMGKLLLSINKPKIFFHEHVPSFQLDFFTKLLLRKVDAYVAVQDKMREWAVTNKTVVASKAFYLANTVSAPESLALTTTNNNAGKILMVANFREIKNQLFAISLLEALPNEYSLDLYGTVDEIDYYEKIEATIRYKSLKNRVRVVKGVTNIYEQLSNYKLAIHTASGETGPLVLIEYLYAGLPFITYNTGDVVNILNQYLPEFIINNFNIEEWVQKIKTFNQKQKFDDEKLKMKEVIKNHFSESAYLNQLMFIYQQLMA